MNYQAIFDRLWVDYRLQNPAVEKVYNLFESEGEQVINDHIAFRTFQDARVGVDVLATPFLKAGYQQKNEYFFAEKKLRAVHFEHESDELAPRVFISELLWKEFSPEFQAIIEKTLDKIKLDEINADELIYAGVIWGSISHEVYEHLRKESEYAAWLYAFGFRANHFTISVNHLKKYTEVESVNTLLKEHGFRINDSGGEIKGSKSIYLEQSSIKSGFVPVNFIEGTIETPGCYYEFAKRYPTENGKLYGGFVADSANKVFESTDLK
ncbi:MAG: DUF1338 domain-containing protein [Bacteroidales bacterium]|nr:DUF1338 domain-containing protein [Bacteroidales bacterium]